MKKKIEIIFAAITLLLGIVHIVLTPEFYDSLTEDAHIFIGMGLAFIFLAAINFIRIFAFSKVAAGLCIIANLLSSIYMTLPIIFIGVSESQWFIAYIDVVTITALSILDIKKLKSSIIL